MIKDNDLPELDIETTFGRVHSPNVGALAEHFAAILKALKVNATRSQGLVEALQEIIDIRRNGSESWDSVCSRINKIASDAVKKYQ